VLILGDVCRCQDDACPWCENCERWRQRGTGHERTPVAASLREDDGTCRHLIERNYGESMNPK